MNYLPSRDKRWTGMELPKKDSGDVDLHAARHGLKQLKDSGSTKLFQNRKGFSCPCCGLEFDHLYVSEERRNRFDPSDPQAFCVVLETDRFLLLTHPK